jgi:hypothetical protein
MTRSNSIGIRGLGSAISTASVRNSPLWALTIPNVPGIEKYPPAGGGLPPMI